MAVKGVIKQTNLRGSNGDDLQIVGVVYINGDEYRVYAPPAATGDPIEWRAHFAVRRASGFSAEEEVTGTNCELSINATCDELERMKAGNRNPGRITSEKLSPDSTMTSSATPHLLLISHSSKDLSLVTAVTEFFRVGLCLRSEQIRCSSVDGYRLSAGADTEARLRAEVNSAEVVIGLITPNSLSSPYVLFELGARWGAQRPMIPLLAGLTPEDIKGPLSSLNALTSSNASQLHQMLADISQVLKIPIEKPASYQPSLEAVIRETAAFKDIRFPSEPEPERMIFEESVYWKRIDSNKEGPYCPVCYDDKKKEIHLKKGTAKGAYRCGVCHNAFTTGEYAPEVAPRVIGHIGPWS